MAICDFDWVVVNSSAGKDSQCMLDVVFEEASKEGITSRLVVVHADLGEVEWPGTKELAERQASHYNLRFEVVRRRAADGKSHSLLAQVRKRGKWPSPTIRYCTSDHKRGPVTTLFTRLVRESRSRGHTGRVRILNCLGLRGQESCVRAKLEPSSFDARASNRRREVWTWLPIHRWSTEQVWDRIRASGVPYHPAYDLGMPRLSCCFCIYSPRSALMLAGKHNPQLLDRYVETEKAIGHSFRVGLPIVSIKESLARDEPVGHLTDWEM